MKTFLSWPTRSGWLTIANMLTWVSFFLILGTDFSEQGIGFALRSILLVMLLVMVWPVAAFLVCAGSEWFLPPELTASVIVLNSFLWGYGVDWFLKDKPSRRERSARASNQNQVPH